MRDNILKVIKTLYALVDQHRESLEEQIVLLQDIEGEKEKILGDYDEEQILGLQLLADVALQDAILRWVNANNLQALTVQQRQDLFGLMAQFKPDAEVHRGDIGQPPVDEPR